MKRIRDIVRNNVGYQSDTMNYLGRFLNKGNRVSQLGNLVLNLSRKALGKRDGFGFVDNAVNPELFHVYQAVGDGLPSLSGLYRMISNKAVKVVSFDIFDTLLCRPTIDPTDIFGYVAMQVDRKYGIDFASIRASIEPRLNNPYTTFEDIYVEFGRISKLSKSDVDEIKALELQTERQLLFPRKEIRAVYEHAVKEGKRIIATSDMYIDGKTLLEILHQNGYVAIDRVYVSCDERARKDQDGQLFDHVLAEEGITCSELLHVGDNEKSDYAYPVQKGISAFWYPSVITQIYRNDTLWRKFYPDRFAGFDIGTRMVYGYLLNMYGHLLMERKNAHMYGNAYEFGLFGLGPIVLMSMVKVLHDDRIWNCFNSFDMFSKSIVGDSDLFPEFMNRLICKIESDFVMHEISDGVDDALKLITSSFREIAHTFSPDTISRIDNILRQVFSLSPYCELSIFDDLKNGFKFDGDCLCQYQHEVQGSEFLNPENYYNFNYSPDTCKLEQPPKIGIHIHIFDFTILQDILFYFAEFPYAFDLYITTCKHDTDFIVTQFRSFAEKMNKIEVITVPNRGRDVAPWLIEIGPICEEYDFFCHLHGKTSSYSSFGREWRDYLFKNLVGVDAIPGILGVLASDDKVGVVFPAPYRNVFYAHVSGIPFHGEVLELIEDMFFKMNIPSTVQRRDFCFSVGTMMWYRPECLSPVFNSGLCYDDFPEEPIGVDGTYAHAIEKVIEPVCRFSGYCLAIMTPSDADKSIEPFFWGEAL